MPGRVVAAITQVDTPHEGDQAPLQGLIAHVGVGCRLGTAGRAVVTRAAPPYLLQLVLGPGTFASSSPSTACNTRFQVMWERGGGGSLRGLDTSSHRLSRTPAARTCGMWDLVMGCA